MRNIPVYFFALGRNNRVIYIYNILFYHFSVSLLFTFSYFMNWTMRVWDFKVGMEILHRKPFKMAQSQITLNLHVYPKTSLIGISYHHGVSEAHFFHDHYCISVNDEACWLWAFIAATLRCSGEEFESVGNNFTVSSPTGVCLKRKGNDGNYYVLSGNIRQKIRLSKAYLIFSLYLMHLFHVLWRNAILAFICIGFNWLSSCKERKASKNYKIYKLAFKLSPSLISVVQGSASVYSLESVGLNLPESVYFSNFRLLCFPCSSTKPIQT